MITTQPSSFQETLATYQLFGLTAAPQNSIKEVRRIDGALKVTNLTLLKVPFDVKYWQKVAEEAGPPPEPYSNDPSQWLFKGRPEDSTDPLQLAVARLLGYRWPSQDPDDLNNLADKDGIVCVPPVAGEPPAAEQLRSLLAVAYGDDWSTSVLDGLLTESGAGKAGLEGWLRDKFVASHCKLFHNRPFIWQIWDGRNDGFSVLVNYHKLNRALLDRLTYTTLNSWISHQRADAEADVAGAEARLASALELQEKLKLIAEGAPPLDVYVRWKPLSEQPIGWDPDPNDGVRLNIRPFVTAGILRNKFTISWNKDRGKNPDGSDRLNDIHCTHADKKAAKREEVVD